MKVLLTALVISIVASGCARIMVKKSECEDAGEHLLCKRAWTVM
jgi:uncharacterized protein YceK